ncbi:hypothetical protein [Acidisphaera sp. S103]|uniref:hypothetical protein n=1 Tax=Acidisphaera sp. S103 TaxID=1747223 RepID=UPI00131C7AC3|nr:hypothetical protein [Acidisphaera sp. S103]
MASADTTQAYSLLPWVRRGIASRISGTPAVNYATVPVSVAVNGAPVPAPPNVRLPGPGDVKTMDARAFIRTDPMDGTDNFEPNYLAIVELATPDLPWLYTPVGVNGSRLQPWISLIVIPEGDGVTLTPQAGGPSLLRIDSPLDPAAELPDLTQADAWVHVQIAGSDLSTAALSGDSGATLSRLVSPRALVANQHYLACVVPTYHAGVNAGLGLTVDDADLALAWTKTVTAPFTLPVYFSFRFQTEANGDFASLARKIGPPTSPVVIGTRSTDFSQPGFGAAAAPGVTLGLEGALRSFNTADTPWPAGAQAAYEAQLRAVLSPPAAADPVVTPPLYGRTQSGAALPADSASPLWFGELNLDPRNRTAAALGGQVVQAGADAMVAAAWAQIGEIRKANQLLRQSQLARAVAGSLSRRHLQTVAGDGIYLQITSPTHRRVNVTLSGSALTLAGHVAASRIPDTAVLAAMRRLARPRGPIGRQLAAAAPAAPQQIVDRLNIVPASTPPATGPSAIVAAGPVKPPAGMVALDSVSPAFQVAGMTATLLTSAPGWLRTVAVSTTATATTKAETETEAAKAPLAIDIKPVEPVAPVSPIEPVKPIAPIPPVGPIVPVGPVAPVGAVAPPIVNWRNDASIPAILQSGAATMPAPFVFPSNAADLQVLQGAFSASAASVNAYIGTGDAPATDPPSLGGTSALATTRAALAARLDPALAIKARIGVRVPLGSGSDPLQPLTAAPGFPQAMYEALAALSPEWMLPGISAIPADSAVLLKTNPAFVEAYMVGLNEDFARELLWRQFPAQRNATWFQCFWADGTADIPAIAEFDPAGNLGDHTQDHTASGRLALLVRSDLFRRYPNALVSACPAVWSGTTRMMSTTRQWPVFQGQIGDDCRFFGFDIDDPFGLSDPAANRPGTYFVIEEHLTEPRFGLEPAGSLPPENPVWNDLGWDHVTLTGNFLDPATPPSFTSTESVAWSDDSSAMAFILMRRPLRIAMHATALVAEEQA